MTSNRESLVFDGLDLNAGAQPPPPPPFDPTTIPGLQAWFKADAGTSTTTDGAAVSQWNDQSGNARHATQATGTKQPLYKAAIQNGLPVVRFDGVDDFLATSSFTQAQPATWFAVVKFATVGTSDKAVFDGSGTFQNILNVPSATSVYRIYAGANLDTTGTTPLAWHAMSCVFNGASSGVWQDGASVASGNPSSGGISGGITLGAAGGGGGQWGPIDLGELLLYSGALSTANRQAVEQGMKSKWGTP